MSTVRTLSNLLRDANSPFGRLVERSRVHRGLQLRLESLLGGEIAAHCRVQNLREGTLILQVDASSWAARLRFELPRLLERLRATPDLRQLRDIQIRVAVPDQPHTSTSRPARLSREAAAVIESAAAATQDPPLREALRRLAHKSRD